MYDDEDNGDERDKHYRRELRALQIELVKLQRHLMKEDARVLVILEGRDGAGKDGTIKRLTEHMSPARHADTCAEQAVRPRRIAMVFPALRAASAERGEFVIFNRSWYNRAGVERVMGFATEDQVGAFMENVVRFEQMLVRDGIILRKYYLDISKKEQKKRLAEREKSPLKQWKTSPIDACATQKWHDYSKARDDMFRRTSHPIAPWRVVHTDTKKIARLEFLRDLLEGFSYPHKNKKLTRPDRSVVFPWSAEAELRGHIAK